MIRSTYIGKKFGRLTVIASEGRKDDCCRVTCKCDCGNIIHGIATRELRRGHKKSCGCIMQEKQNTLIKQNKYLHYIWEGMKQRCNNPNHHKWKDYGGRGIKICDEWKNDFAVFCDWALHNNYQKGLSIDRIDNDGDYEPSNCRWITLKQQNYNKRTSVMVTINGITKCLAEWKEINGISERLYRSRMRRGWSVEEACTRGV